VHSGISSSNVILVPLHIQNLLAYNTRVFKQSGSGGDIYELRIASVVTGGLFLYS